ncbi:MAG TPA: sensor histidine kinase, partial [Proteobacteria bacterium]|nr:sensor histidine kinase [Pseudomonadota bacterium]
MLRELLMFLLYLFYGGVFFAIGVAITSKDTSASNLGIARNLWIFALFAYTHGIHEWFEMYLNLASRPIAVQLVITFQIVQISLMFVSFSFLLLFGTRIMGYVLPAKRHWFSLFAVIIVVAWFGMILATNNKGTMDFFSMADLHMRNIIALPAALLSGCGFFIFSRTVLQISKKGGLNFAGAGISLILYGFATGMIRSGSIVPLLGVPIELIRGITAFAILHFIMNALHIFDVERKSLIEEQLTRFAKSEKLSSLGKLAAGIAHEINNPLANASINVEMLKKEMTQDRENGSFPKRLSAIEGSIDRASRIARELLDFSSDRSAEFSQTDLGDVIQSTLDLMRGEWKNHSITLDLDGSPMIRAIPWKLEEVFLNIFINAIDAMPDGGDIHVEARGENGEVFVRVTDTGTGIPPEHIDMVMDPFYTTKEVGQGTGLGLSICFG